MSNAEKALEAIEIAKNTGKIKKGINEVTKALERGTAKLVAYAKDVQPKEITLHMPVLAKEKNVPCVEIGSKEELGTAAGINVPTSAVAVINEGDSKKIIEELKPKPEAKKLEAEPKKTETKAEAQKSKISDAPDKAKKTE